DNPAPATISGDIERGAALYRNCASCHGSEGQGIWSVAAPRQAGMSDWYLAAQLQNFKDGLRGAHPDDGVGWQMALMAEILRDEQAINDVVAYINTLRTEGASPDGDTASVAMSSRSRRGAASNRINGRYRWHTLRLQIDKRNCTIPKAS
ncbi:MAG: c-type cytochrome, partial [Gammaproteobacteria bacterium]